MTATRRRPQDPRSRGRYRHGRRPVRGFRLVLAVLFAVGGLTPALYTHLARSAGPAGVPDAALAARQGPAGPPMPSMPGMSMPGNPAPAGQPPVVPPEIPLYTGPPPNDAPLSPADREFLVRVRQAGLWEGPAGRMAQTRSDNAAVKATGLHMIAGHAELDAKVLALGRMLDVPLPAQPSDAQQGWLAELTSAKAPQDFDRVFVNRLRAAHGVVFGIVAQVRADARNSVIRSFAQRTMEVVLDHMTMLESTGLVDYGQLPQPKLLPGAADVPTVRTPDGPMSAADQDFLVRVRLAGLWEGPSGRLAQQRGGTTRVKTAGQHMVMGHAELDTTVLVLSRQLHVTLPTEPNHDQKTWLGEMVAAPDAQAFDQVFVDRLRAAHGTVYGYVAAVRADTGNSAIRAFATRALQVVLDHITMLERTGLVRYDTLPQPTLPSAAAAPVPAAASSPRGRLRTLGFGIAGMLVLAAFVTVVARRDSHAVPAAGAHEA